MFKYIWQIDIKDRNVEKAKSKTVFVFISHPRSKSIHTFYRQEFYSNKQTLESTWFTIMKNRSLSDFGPVTWKTRREVFPTLLEIIFLTISKASICTR